MGHVICVAQQKGGSGKTTIAANLAVAFSRAGQSVALLDTDPQGSLGRWFMARRDLGGEDLGFSTASAWGVSYECDKLRRAFDWVIVDTPPKVDADLRPALREADLVIVPVSVSQVDVWATDSVLDLARREGRTTLIVLNRAKRGTRLLERGGDIARGARGAARDDHARQPGGLCRDAGPGARGGRARQGRVDRRDPRPRRRGQGRARGVRRAAGPPARVSRAAGRSRFRGRRGRTGSRRSRPGRP
jgi:chromosome partitioning protein